MLAFNNLFDLYDRSNQLEKFSSLLSKAKKELDDKDLVGFFSGVHQYKKKKLFRSNRYSRELKLRKELCNS